MIDHSPARFIKATVVHVWTEREIAMVRVESGPRVYNVPPRCSWTEDIPVSQNS
jgi:hypothetical protein